MERSMRRSGRLSRASRRNARCLANVSMRSSPRSGRAAHRSSPANPKTRPRRGSGSTPWCIWAASDGEVSKAEMKLLEPIGARIDYTAIDLRNMVRKEQRRLYIESGSSCARSGRRLGASGGQPLLHGSSGICGKEIRGLNIPAHALENPSPQHTGSAGILPASLRRRCPGRVSGPGRPSRTWERRRLAGSPASSTCELRITAASDSCVSPVSRTCAETMPAGTPALPV